MSVENKLIENKLIENKLIEYNQNGGKISCIFEFQPAIRTFVIYEYSNYDDEYEDDYYEDYEEKRVLEALSYHQFHIDYYIKTNKKPTMNMNHFHFTETEIPYKNSNVVNLISIAENIGSSRVCLGNVNVNFNYNSKDAKNSVLLASNKLINHFFYSNYTGFYNGIERRTTEKSLFLRSKQ